MSDQEAVEVKVNPGQQVVQPKIKWNDSEMQTSYANVCNVLGSRDEIAVLFGTNQAWQAGVDEVEVMLQHRMLLSPHAAKRLSVLLSMGLKEYESRFGEIKL